MRVAIFVASIMAYNLQESLTIDLNLASMVIDNSQLPYSFIQPILLFSYGFNMSGLLEVFLLIMLLLGWKNVFLIKSPVSFQA